MDEPKDPPSVELIWGRERRVLEARGGEPASPTLSGVGL